MVPEHEALVAWWKSPAGRSRSQRMHEMNTSRATKQRALSLSGIQNQQKALPQIESTSEVGFVASLSFKSTSNFFSLHSCLTLSWSEVCQFF